MTLRLNGSSSGYVQIASPAAAGSNTLTLPASNGSANQALVNSSSAGVLTFANYYGPAFRVHMDGNQTISTATNSVIEFDDESYDTDSMFDTSAYKFTPTVAGYYYLHLSCEIEIGTQNHSISCTIERVPTSGSTTDEGLTYLWNEGFDTTLTLNVSALVQVAESNTDYFRTIIYQNSGQNKTLQAGFRKTTFMGHWVRPL